MDTEVAWGYKARRNFPLGSFILHSDLGTMDKEFLNQIDSASELLNPSNSLDDDVLICECFCVSAGDIRDLCAQKAEVDLTELRENFNFGEGCRSCIKNIDSWLKNIF